MNINTACSCHGQCCCSKPYGFFNFLVDIFMLVFTLGLWVIWIFVREMRGRR